MTPRTIALMLESDGPGGAELVLLRLAEALHARGHEIVPVIPAEGVGWLGPKLRACGFEPEEFREGPPPDLHLALDLFRRLRRRGVEVIHSHEFTMAVYGALASRFLRRPHVITIHGAHRMLDAWRRRVAIRCACRASQVVVAVSEATQRLLAVELRLPPERIAVVRNGVPVRSGDPAPIREEFGLAPGDVLIVAVGSLDVHKGHVFLLEALVRLSDEGLRVPWQVVIVGGRGGDQHDRLERFADEHGVAERLHLLSYRDDVPNLLAAADVFAMPSLWEGLPLALLEAMLAGTAIVASDVSGIPEAVKSGEHGLLVPPGDAGALARALRKLLEDPPTRARLAEAARRRAHREFTLAAMVDGYERIYEEAASSTLRWA